MPQIKTHTFGTHSLTFRGSLLWSALSDDIKIVKISQLSKRKLKPGKEQTAAVHYAINRTFTFFTLLLSIIQICLVS